MIVSVAEHHSNIVPWQMTCQATGATLRVLPLTKDTQEVDMQVCCIAELEALQKRTHMCLCCHASSARDTDRGLMFGLAFFQAFKEMLSEKTKIVALVYVSNMLGSILDTDYITEQTRKVWTV